ncbi:MAG: flavin-dependent oxidoreductase [Rhodobacteraceae bacterium]|nr:flavin-dependent oxidoreductase [Paracoccaceae bacterium]
MVVIISGAGIGGLTVALTCHQLGIPVKVFEAVPKITPLGVGINLQPHAVRELFELGLADQLDAIGLRTREVAYFSKHGLPIWAEDRGKWAGYNWPQYSVHRGALQMLLLDAVMARLGADCVTTASKVTGFEQTASGVLVTINGEQQVQGDVLIAADGIHSTIRAGFYPDEGAPVWGGAVLWRGTTRAKAFLSGASMAMAGHKDLKFVTYPISQPDENGLSLINWIADVKFDNSATWNREDYNRQGKLADFLPKFGDWNFDWLDIPDLIRKADAIYEFPMIDRNPLERWSFGNITLLGDAAHAMYPIGSNGATQAIIDARVLGKYFKSHGINAAALKAYDAERRPICNAVVLANRGNGPDQVLQVVEQRCKGRFDRVEDILSPNEMAKMAADYKKVAGFDVETLNNAPSILGKLDDKNT